MDGLDARMDLMNQKVGVKVSILITHIINLIFIIIMGVESTLADLGSQILY